MKIRFNRNVLIAFLFVSFLCSSLLFGFTSNTIKKDPLNPTAFKTALGQYLFFDIRLSYNQQKSCASCHDPKFCFTDGYRTSAGADGFNVKHNAPSLINSSFLNYLTWSDSSIQQLETQLSSPLFNTHPVELGWRGNETAILLRIASDSFYQETFKKAFPLEKTPINTKNTIHAITAFEASLTSFQSAYDQFRNGISTALSKPEIAGMRLFFSDSLNCAKCHDNPTRSIQQAFSFANTGLYNLDKDGAYPIGDQGLFELTAFVRDKGKFRIPSLKNVLLTAPYTHDGSVATIQEMIALYAAGGRNLKEGNFMGDGRKNPNKSKFVNGFKLTKLEQFQLIAFLNTFTDTVNLHNPSWRDPFKH